MMRFAAVFALVIVAVPRHDEPRYRERTVEGWSVHVESSLESDALGERVLEHVRVKLYDIARAVPEPALGKLRAVPIWLSRENGVAPCACYHPSGSWLEEHGFDPQKSGGVEIANAATFLSWTREQPSMLLHELAHAYHHQVLGYEHAGLHAAWKRAVDSKRYEEVLHWDGAKQRAYALEIETEFLAELTEAWFGTNDFYPFVRAEVLDFDPETARLLCEIWGG